jgi:hypothetical protein
VALPLKKHLPDVQSEFTRRGGGAKISDFGGGDKRAFPIVKRSFAIDFLENHCKS